MDLIPFGLVVKVDFARTLEREAARLAEENKRLQKKCDEWQLAHAEACEMIQAGKREAKRLAALVREYEDQWVEDNI